MPCPPEIVAAFESVVDIYFSAVRHRERAAFILCDNLVEMACKTRAYQNDATFNRRCNFHQALEAAGVKRRLTKPLRERLKAFHETRNDFQHKNAAGTVGASLCADAIGAAREALLKLWPDAGFPPKLTCGLRLVRLYCTEGDTATQGRFEERVAEFEWRSSNDERVARNAVQIRPGTRDNWSYALHYRTPDVEALLNELGVP